MKKQVTELKNGLYEWYQLPFFDLINRSHQVHREHHNPQHIQQCSLLSIKTGGCPEDCAYCPQSAHYQTKTDRHGVLSLKDVKQAVEQAKENGSERFCMGAAWREVKEGPEFEQVLEMVKIVKGQGLEACVTLGMLNESQAKRLKQVGLDSYNHNIDTSRTYYDKIISTRTFQDRIETLKHVRNAGITICSGGIIGMGESERDRCDMLAELAALDPQPESVPINLLIPVEGTPLEKSTEVSSFELIRIIAVARLAMPKSRVRLSAGRTQLNDEAQALAFFAGANSIFAGETLLTRDNPHPSADQNLFRQLGVASAREQSCPL